MPPEAALLTAASEDVHQDEPVASAAASSFAKRALDLSVATALLLVLLPLLAVLAAAVWIESGGPVVFRQRRTGFNGEPFVIYKFRTMIETGDAPTVHAVRNDARTTLIGRWLRRSSLDELPQLWNVLKGEMSLIGPRPHAVEHDRYYVQVVDDYSLRFDTRPGLTGLAQISGCRGEIQHVDQMKERVFYDLAYIRSWSLALDFQIALRTLFVAPFDPAAY
jgi:lipopolysaccharide/colanic/teichoic acid biosynthesis glycosyltransferase